MQLAQLKLALSEVHQRDSTSAGATLWRHSRVAETAIVASLGDERVQWRNGGRVCGLDDAGSGLSCSTQDSAAFAKMAPYRFT